MPQRTGRTGRAGRGEVGAGGSGQGGSPASIILGSIFDDNIYSTEVQPNQYFGKQPGEVDYTYKYDPSELVSQEFVGLGGTPNSKSRKYSASFRTENALADDEDRRNLKFQQNLADLLTKAEIDRELRLGPARNQNALMLEAATGDLNLYNEAVKNKQTREHYAEMTPLEVNRALGNAQATFYGTRGAGMDTANVDLANKLYRGEQGNKISANEYLAAEQALTRNARLAKAQAEADLLARTAGIRYNAALTPEGEAATRLGFFGEQVKAAADASRAAAVNLSPAEVSRQPLSSIFGPYFPEYQHGAIPIEEEGMSYYPGKDGKLIPIPSGKTTKSYRLPVADVTPDILAQARAIIDRGQSGRAPASRVGPYSDGYQYVNPASAPTPVPLPTTVPTQGPARLPAVSLPPEIQAASDEYFGRPKASDMLSVLTPFGGLLSGGKNLLENIFIQNPSNRAFMKAERERAAKYEASGGRRKKLQQLLSDYYE